MEQNYLPLFRKYRPQSFKDIVGQKSLVKALSNAIELNRIANAYLFCGPRGTGKTSTARILAKSLNCEHGPTLEPCQKCASCIDITNASGLDVIEIDAASNRGIQDAKDMITQAQYAPINGKYKIFIIDEVHMLSNEAFNALLKTFEEPPENVIFILATTEPHKVLETIVSRCQRFDLRRITVDDIVKRLREISNLENIKITDSALFTIAKNVSGGLRDSLALLDQVSILGTKDTIDKDLIEELLGKVNFDTLLDLLQKINSKDIELIIQKINEIYLKGNEPRNLAENFIEFLRNVTLVLSSQDTESIMSFTNLIQDDIEKIKKSNFDKNKILKILNIFIEYYKEIKISTNPYLWMELAGISACNPELNNKENSENIIAQQNTAISKPQIAKSSVKQTIETVNIPKTNEKTVSDKISEEENITAKEEQPQSTSDNLDNNDILKLWTNIINSIASPPTKAFFAGVAKLVEIKDKKITLGFLNENLINQAKSPMKLSPLQNAINSIANGYEVEFTKISPETKTLNIKPKITPLPSANQVQAKAIAAQVPQTLQRSNNEEDFGNEQKEEKNTNRQYSAEVQEMLEQYSGRIID